ncbi:hypothetical protein N7520_000786 [Penicillium odoratum]|uniref:uncharacterized protein n=1 Tax=Penicillium odoratum TaxID=1167516 RepID=UPI002548A603|nr:uncharacterized protein N7520_000786 [Penicillium odoratum]KAJ5777540.1 hypothetical protein N7520_000786 [Penicillium odoratum]
MAPSEESILSNFLLVPASLPTVLSLQKFTELFPKRLRNHPHIRSLYRELQQTREHDMDQVNENIDNEIQQGERQRAELHKASLAAGVEAANEDEQREVDMDLHLFGQTALNLQDYHSVESLLTEMETACAHIQEEIDDMDQDSKGLVAQLSTTVGDLSDLRYGKFAGPGSAKDVAEQSINALQNLEDTCYQKSMPGA